MQRNFGLDVARSFAIVPVVLYHTSLPLPGVRVYGLFGVEVFLTLSGFLIAQMIFERFDGLSSRAAFFRFMQNRWWRTLPLYFLFLVTELALELWRGGRPPALPYVFFAQSLIDGGFYRYDNWFGSSWTLALEEWFYLLTAVVAVALPLAGKRSKMAGYFAVLIALGLTARLVRYTVFDPGSFSADDMYRRPMIMRLDAFSWGALAYFAVTGTFGERVGRLVDRHKAKLAALGAAAAAGLLALCLLHKPSVEKVLVFTGLPAGLALLLPLTLEVKPPHEFVRQAAYFISTRTYAIYLSHGMVFFAMARLGQHVTLANLALYLALILLLADALYRWFERPLIGLRPLSAGPAPQAAQASSAAAVTRLRPPRLEA